MNDSAIKHPPEAPSSRQPDRHTSPTLPTSIAPRSPSLVSPSSLCQPMAEPNGRLGFRSHSPPPFTGAPPSPPQPPLNAKLLQHHEEKHFTAGEVVRDIIIGVSDGLTVPFALAAGLSGADAPSSIVLTAGIAEVAAGAVSMGLGGYLAAKSETDHYLRELKREQEEIINVPDTEAAEIEEILSEYGLGPYEYGPVVTALRNNPKAWLEFMMKFELGLEKPDPRRALQSAATIAGAYVLGGVVPLVPYVFQPVARKAIVISVVATLLALLFFGYVKGRLTGARPVISALQTTFIGAVASAAAYGMAKAFQAL